ncbi:COPI associated protein [Seminavis robusta]|uniref:COPI associated protein n=1 Tax=Seminavis robusta TaxID=568900 RepID=A0A9N8HRP5_9STRA|nr:COPI associated protein [Seminavis robusta]|eukprot:Sro1295_g260290.1 COPI associated protein (209) ;mRNA; r:20364-21134
MSSEEADPALKEWSKKEEANQNEQMRSQLERLTKGPRKSCLHRTFNLLSFVMGMAGFLMIIGQLIGLYYYEMDPIQGIMRGYVVLMSLLVILTELQWFQFIRESAILRIWITRGIFYSFVGVLGLEENDTTKISSEHVGVASAVKFVEVVAYIMVGCGCLYFVMGCLCLQLIYNRVVTDYEQRVSEAKANQKKVTGGYKDPTSNGSMA